MDPAGALEPRLPARIAAIEAQLTDGAIGVSAYDFLTGRAWSVNGGAWFHAASLIKLPILIGVFDAAAQGRFTLDCRLHVRNRFLSAYDGAPFRVDAGRDADKDVHAAIGRTMHLHELARHMIITSSNLATNLLLDLVGVDAIAATMKGLGVEGVDLQRGVEDDRAFEAGRNNRITADGACALIRAIVEGRAVSPRAAGEMLGILHDQRFEGAITAGLPEMVRATARVAHKTGEISTVTHDAGAVYLPSRPPFAAAILVSSSGSGRDRNDAAGAAAAAVYECVAAAGEGVLR